MAINFPTSPTVGDTYTVNSVVYTWDGTKWNASTGFVSYTYADKIQEGDSSAEIVDNGGDAYFVVTNNAVEKFRVNVDGQLGTPYAGNASSPALYMGGDINSGLYSAGADQVAVATNGVGRLFVDASGNVGVGTASPAAPLHINSGTSNLCATLESSDVGAGISFKDNVSTGFNGIQVDRDDMRVFTANAEKLRITSAGLVGIGTSAPATNLHIASTNAQLRLQDTDGTNQFGQISQSAGILYFFNRNNVSYGEIRFQQNNGTTTLTPLTIDSSQRVGIGTTSPQDLLHIEAASPVLRGVDTDNNAIAKVNFGSGNITLDADAGNISASSIINFKVDGTEHARIDSSGRLLVGTSSSLGGTVSIAGGGLYLSANDSNAEMQLTRASANSGSPLYWFNKARGTYASPTVVSDGDICGTLTFRGHDGSAYIAGASIAAAVDGTPGPNDMPGRLVFSTTADGASSSTERMRIGASGAVRIGQTTEDEPGNGNTTAGVGITAAGTGNYSATNVPGIRVNRNNSDGTAVTLLRQGSAVGTISVTTTATAYNTSSDYRLKENVVPLTGAADRLKLIPVHRFNFIADPDTTVDGFLAHEAQAVVPEAVHGTKDEVDADGNPVYQGIDQSKLVPLLTAALQEALAKIETLEQRLASAGIA